MIVIFVILIIGGLFLKRKNRIFDYLIILFLCFLQFFQIGSPDYENYKVVYDFIGSGYRYLDTGYGWLVLCKFGNILCLNYREFQVVLLFICLLIIMWVVNKIVGTTKNTHMFYSLYLLYPALMDLVQFRFFVATVLVFLGISFLNENSFFNYIKFITCVIIAFTIHSATLFYMIFILIPIFNKIKIALCMLVTVFSIGFFVFKSQLLSFIALFINEARVNRYLQSTDSVGIYGLIAYIVTLIIFNIILYKASIITKTVQDKKTKVFIDNIYSISLLFWVVLPLSSFDTNLFRIQRIMWPLLYLVLVLMFNQKIYKIKIFEVEISIKCIAFFLAIFGFIFYILWFNFDVIKVFLL